MRRALKLKHFARSVLEKIKGGGANAQPLFDVTVPTYAAISGSIGSAKNRPSTDATYELQRGRLLAAAGMRLRISQESNAER
jgi:hypothetical protein